MENKAIENQTGICPVCNRPLKHPKSVAMGIGPVCARKQKEVEARKQLELELETNEELGITGE